MPGQGIIARCALGVESSFRTAVAVSEIIPFSSESINRVINQLMTEYLDGNVGLKGLRPSTIEITGTLEGELVWDEEAGDPIGIERILRGSMGGSARDGANALNQYTLANTIDEIYTICFNKQTSNWEIVSGKFNTLGLSGEAGEKIMFSTDVIAYNLLRTGDAGITNAIAAVTGLSNTNQPTNITFNDLVFRIADQGDAIAAADEYKISSFDFVMNNNLSEPEFSTKENAGHTDNSLTLEPVRNGFREIEFSITLPRYESDQFFTWLNNNTPLQADLKFASGSYEFNIYLPNIYVGGEPTAAIGGAELIRHEVPIKLIRNAGTNTNMTLQDSTAITEEFAIEAKSGRTTAA